MLHISILIIFMTICYTNSLPLNANMDNSEVVLKRSKRQYIKPGVDGSFINAPTNDNNRLLNNRRTPTKLITFSELEANTNNVNIRQDNSATKREESLTLNPVSLAFRIKKFFNW
jgi:hypothetical protein